MLKYLVIAAGILTATPAVADGPMPQGCNRLKAALDRLAENFDEAPAAMGLQMDGTLLTILVSPDGQTWTALLTDPTGIACVVGEGRNWEMRVAPKGDPA